MNPQYRNLGHMGVLMGGCSSERAISLKSGQAVFKALRDLGCFVSPIELNSTREEEIDFLLRQARVDVVFIALHGKFGEDGQIQSLLQKLGIPYTGSDAKASQVAMNKGLTQMLLKEQEILVPNFIVLNKEDLKSIDDLLSGFAPFPLMIKPISEGSSIGISMAKTQKQLKEAMDQSFRYGPEIMIEQYIGGKEMTAGILGREVLPLVEIKSIRDFFDFTAKYQKGWTDYFVPAEISADLTKKIQTIALRVFEIIGCRDMARVDFIVDAQGNPFVLEINTIPGFTETSLLPKAAQVAGYSFSDLCLKIVQMAIQRLVKMSV